MNFLFDFFKQELRDNISREEFTIWLSDLSLIDFRDKKLILQTDSEFKKERICSQYSSSIQNALSKQGFSACQVDIQVKPSLITDELSGELQANKPSMAGKSSIIQKSSQIEVIPSKKEDSKDHNIKPELTLENYVPGDFNKIAIGFVQKVKEKLGKINPLYIYSKVGLGKTHLIHALGNYYLKTFPFLRIKCINPNDFVSEFTKSLAEKRDRQFRLKYRSLDILLLDDIQFFMGKDKSCVEFFHIFNEIYSPGKQMIFCSDCLPEELNAIDERLKSRLSSSAIVGIEALNKADKKKLLNHYLDKNDLNVHHVVLDFIVNHLPSDVRKIIGLVNTLVVYRDIYDKDITIDFCRQYLKQLIFKIEGTNVSPDKLLLTIANISKIPISEFKTPKRSKTLSYYRQILMYVLRKHTHLSLPEIGRFLGGKTNSAILFGVNKIAKELKHNHELKQVVDQILQTA